MAQKYICLGWLPGEFPAMETIFVIAANRFFRESLIRLFRNDKGFRVTGAANFSPLLGEHGSRINPDIVILRPDWDDRAFVAARAIHEVAPGTKILMIGMEDDQEMFFKAVRAGAEGYLLKDASAKQIVAAAHRLARSVVVCPPHLERALFRLLAKDSGPDGLRLPGTCELTPREHQLTSLVARGLANKEIAGRLNLSVQTVKNHVHNILQKTQSKNRAMLVQFVEAKPPADGTTSRLSARLSASS
jgi:DNA-binding NarL/FixJ family response regulator